MAFHDALAASVTLPGKSRLRCRVDRGGCPACGSRRFRRRRVLPPELIATWELDTAQASRFDAREGDLCEGCGQSLRVRMLTWTVRRLVGSLKGLAVLHLNRINGFEAVLEGAAVTATAYDPSAPFGEDLGGVSNEDFENLSYPDASFDLVVHSETLEHVFAPAEALAEAHRVLRPGGLQVYTVPLVHGRSTRQRMRRGPDGEVVSLLPPSHHGLEGEYPVVWEFGRDFLVSRRRSLLGVFYDDALANPTVFTAVEAAPFEATSISWPPPR